MNGLYGSSYTATPNGIEYKTTTEILPDFMMKIPTGARMGLMGAVVGGLLGSLVSKNGAMYGAIGVGLFGGLFGHALDNTKPGPSML